MHGARLGDFILEEPLGQGGMGAVWAGHHHRTRRPVAIKILLHAQTRDPVWRAAFANEIRVVAGLDHPNIVALLAQGEIPEGFATFPAGAPYMVMEQADGTLREQRSEEADIRSVMRPLLAALAHAHARGVLHRDIKPANVLVVHRKGARRLLLSDFGIAFDERHQQAADLQRRWGTPGYMAPEQRSESDWPQGPWTDLYAVGCLAVSLLTGRPPQRAEGAVSTLPLSVPLPLRRWVSCLLSPSPHMRFAAAADALAALDALDPLLIPGALSDTEPTATQPTAAAPGLEELPPVAAFSAMTPAPAPQPADWRTPYLHRRRWEEEGLSLYGLRSVPFVGREAERAKLWAALAACRQAHRPIVFLLRGPSGAGKSRLASWLCERAAETGAAWTLHVTHSPVPGLPDGVWAALGRLWRCRGSRLEPMLRRIQQHIDDPEDVDEILGRLTGRAGSGSSAEEAALLVRALEAITADRPAVLWIDDVQWGPDALTLVEALSRKPLPLVMALTAQEEALAEQPELRHQLDAMLAAGRAEAMPISALSRLDMQAMLHQLAGLEGGLLGRLQERVGGNPLFAVQLIDDWVQRGLLLPGPDGFRLPEGAHGALPASLGKTWTAQVEGLLGATELESLELAAALGQDVVLTEWRAVCEAASRPPPEGLLRRLTRRCLMRAVPGGERVAFAHGMIREGLLQRAASAGRLRQHYQRCAQVAASPQRRGRLLLLAGQPDEAAPLLWMAIRADIVSGHRLSSLVGVRRYRDALDAMGAPGSDPRRGEARLAEARTLLYSGRAEQAEDVLKALETAASRHGWDSVLFLAWVFQAQLCQQRARFQDAEALLEKMRGLAEGHDDRVAMLLFRESWLRMRQGRIQEAREAALASSRLPRATEHEDLMSRVSLMILLSKTGDTAAARTLALSLLPRIRALRRLNSLADCTNCLGEIAREEGRLEDAERWYREALSCHRRLGSRNYVLSTANLGMVFLERGEPQTARIFLQQATDGLRAQKRTGLTCVVTGLLLRALVVLRERADAAATLGELSAMLTQHPQVADPELLEALTHALAVAPQAPEWESIHARLHELAEAQKTRLSR